MAQDQEIKQVMARFQDGPETEAGWLELIL